MADGRYGRGETTALSLQHTSSCACDTITPVQAGRMALSGKGQGSGRPFVPFSGRAMIFPRSPQEGSANATDRNVRDPKRNRRAQATEEIRPVYCCLSISASHQIQSRTAAVQVIGATDWELDIRTVRGDHEEVRGSDGRMVDGDCETKLCIQARSGKVSSTEGVAYCIQPKLASVAKSNINITCLTQREHS